MTRKILNAGAITRMVGATSLGLLFAVSAAAQDAAEPDFGPAEIEGPDEPGIGGAVEEDIPGGLDEEPSDLQAEVTSLDLAEGEVTLGERTFRAHPRDLADLQPGQLVSVTYDNFEGEDWLASVDAVDDTEEAGDERMDDDPLGDSDPGLDEGAQGAGPEAGDEQMDDDPLGDSDPGYDNP